MSIRSIKVKVGEGIEKEVAGLARELRLFRTELALKSIKYLNPMTERAIIGKAAEEAVRKVWSRYSIKRKLNKLASTKHGKAYINNIVIALAKKYGAEKVEVKGIESTVNYKASLLRKELKQLYRNKELSGINYIEKVREAIFRHFDKDTALKIDKELKIRLLMVELGKQGVVDLFDGRTFYSKENGIRFTSFGREKIGEALTFAGVKKTKYDYYTFKLSEIMLNAVRTSKTPEEATAKFDELYRKTLETDPLFRKAEFEAIARELTKMYNLAGAVGMLQETLKTVPNRLISIVSRMLARAYSMIPIVGALASTQVEAAEAVASLGEAISNKVSSSAYMYYNLQDVLGPLGDQLREHILLTKQAQ